MKKFTGTHSSFTRLLRKVGLGSCVVFLINCSGESSYTAGKPIPVVKTNVEVSATQQELQDLGFNLFSEKNLGLNTGINQCILDAGHKAVEVKDYGVTLDNFLTYDFASVNATTYDQLFLLYDLILQKIVAPDSGLVAYSELQSSYTAQWAKLKELLAAATIPSASSKSSEKALKQAFWMNAYNIAMIDAIVQAPSGIDKANTLSTESGKGIFENSESKNYYFITVGGQKTWLNEIEYGVLGLASSTSTRENAAKKFGAEVIVSDENQYSQAHAGLVCGAVSCPKLRNFAFRPDNVFETLEENLKIFLNDQDKHFIPQGAGSDSAFKVSELLSWFNQDFKDGIAGGSLGGLATKYVSESCRGDKADLESFLNTPDLDLTYGSPNLVTYDWTINKQ